MGKHPPKKCIRTFQEEKERVRKWSATYRKEKENEYYKNLEEKNRPSWIPPAEFKLKDGSIQYGRWMVDTCLGENPDTQGVWSSEDKTDIKLTELVKKQRDILDSALVEGSAEIRKTWGDFTTIPRLVLDYQRAYYDLVSFYEVIAKRNYNTVKYLVNGNNHIMELIELNYEAKQNDLKEVSLEIDNTVESLKEIYLDSHKTACELNPDMCKNCGEEYCQNDQCDEENKVKYIKIEEICTEHWKLCPLHCMDCTKRCCKWICDECAYDRLNCEMYYN